MTESCTRQFPVRISTGFICALVGVALSILAYTGPWFWPGWPAYTALVSIFGPRFEWGDLSPGPRVAVFTALITLNIIFWALIARGIVWLTSYGSRRRSNGIPP